jgi:transmembrane sensor
MSNAAHIEDVAARWLLRREAEDWSSSDQAGLDAWIEADPLHRMAYWRLEHGWGQVDRLSALRAPPAPSATSRATPTWRRPVVIGALAACLLIAIAAPLLGQMGRKTYTTEIGGHEAVPLVDGTRIELNTATQLRAAVSSKTRDVWLDRGEAYFEVAHDAGRPFVVHVGQRQVTVLGTKFSVRREGDRIEVDVVDGRVRVNTGDSAAPPVLTRGDRLIAEGRSTLVTKDEGRVAGALVWRQGLLSFDQSTLGAAAAEFNRYNRKKLVIDDPAAAAMRIGGRFEAENVEAFARLLQEAYGLKVEDDGDTVKISS